MARMAATGGSDGRPRSCVAFWSGVAMMLAGVVAARLRRLAVLGHQLGVPPRAARRSPARCRRSGAATGASGCSRSTCRRARRPRWSGSRRSARSTSSRCSRGSSDDVLARGFGHFPKRAHPGEVGNYALAGHRVTHGEPLRRMPELRPGDSVIVETADATYTYRLDTNPNHLIVPFTGTWVLDPLPKNPERAAYSPRSVAVSG